MSATSDPASSFGSWGLGLTGALQFAADRYGRVLRSIAAFCCRQPAEIQAKTLVH